MIQKNPMSWLRSRDDTHFWVSVWTICIPETICFLLSSFCTRFRFSVDVFSRKYRTQYCALPVNWMTLLKACASRVALVCALVLGFFLAVIRSNSFPVWSNMNWIINLTCRRHILEKVHTKNLFVCVSSSLQTIGLCILEEKLALSKTVQT